MGMNNQKCQQEPFYLSCGGAQRLDNGIKQKIR